jgi:hypothetical protein
VTLQVTANAAGRHLRELAAALRRRGLGRLPARTAGYNVASAAAAGLGGIIVARALGPEMRGEYAAITAWSVLPPRGPGSACVRSGPIRRL